MSGGVCPTQKKKKSKPSPQAGKQKKGGISPKSVNHPPQRNGGPLGDLPKKKSEKRQPGSILLGGKSQRAPEIKGVQKVGEGETEGGEKFIERMTKKKGRHREKKSAALLGFGQTWPGFT